MYADEITLPLETSSCVQGWEVNMIEDRALLAERQAEARTPEAREAFMMTA